MNINEKFDFKGILSIYKIFPNGKKELAYRDENLITLATRQQVLSWCYTYPAIYADPIRWLKTGTGGTIDPDGLFPKPEDETWTDLNTPITTIGSGGLIPVSISVDSSIPQVTFLVDLDQSMGNGYLVTEAGLFKNSGGMFNVKTFPGIPKTSEFSLHFSWTLKFA